MHKRTLWLIAAAVMLVAGMSIAQGNKTSTTDRHIQQHNVSCVGCHGDGQPAAITPKACISCHKSLEAVAERTKGLNYNPHKNHLTETGKVECLQCHQGHREDILACSKCHDGMKFEKK